MFLGKIAVFVGGVVAGSIGSKFLASKSGKEVLTQAVALGIRGYENLAIQTQTLQSEFDDVFNNAKQMNEDRKASLETEVEEF